MDELLKHRKLLLFEGIVFIILGILAIAAPAVFTLGFEQLFGWLFLLSGIIQCYRIYVMRNSPGIFPALLGAIVGIVIGLLMILYPWTGVLTLTVLITIFFLAEGTFKIAFAIALREIVNWKWILFSGILALLLGFLIISGLPGSAAWVLGLLIGVNMLTFGYTMILLASTSESR